VIAIVTTKGTHSPATTWRLRGVRVAPLAVGALALGTAVTAGLSFTGAPLALTFRSAKVGPLQQHLYSVTVTVTNRTGATETPHFMVDLGYVHPDGFWSAAHGRAVVIPPHGTTTVTLYPPTNVYLPASAADYVIDAYTSSPKALSTTKDIWHNYIPTPNST